MVRLLQIFLLSLFVLGVQSSAQAEISNLPNIVLLISDDQGWPYHGFTGDPYVQTPNIDSLAAEGTVFNRGYVTASVCVPSLRSFLSGMHSVQWDAKRVAVANEIGPRPYREESQDYYTLPRILRLYSQYMSWEGGKFWSGSFSQAGFTHGLATHVPHEGPYCPLFCSEGSDFGREGWDTALCGSTGDPGTPCPALDPLRIFLDEAQSQGKPFFAWVAPKLPHSPMNAPQEYRDPYETLGLLPREVDYYANVHWLDEFVGELTSELDTRGLTNDTLIIYISDNGWDINVTFPGFGRGKGTPYDLGHKTPVIFRQPGTVPAGVVYDDLVTSNDVHATIVDVGAAGFTPPENEGISLWPRVMGGGPAGHQYVYSDYYGQSIWSDDGWHLIRNDDQTIELYQVDTDPFEASEVSAGNPGVVATLTAELDLWLSGLFDPPSSLEIAGRLIDRTTGLPAQGGQVLLKGGSFTYKQNTNDEGFFVFPNLEHGVYDFRLDDGNRISNLEWEGATGIIDLTLPMSHTGLWVEVEGDANNSLPTPLASTVHGVITDEVTGTPQPGRKVVVKCSISGKSFASQVITGTDGSYRVTGVPADDVVKVIANDFPGYKDETMIVDATVPNHYEVNVALTPK